MDGFELPTNKKEFVLSNTDNIYEFLSEKIEGYMKDFEVLVTDKFKNKHTDGKTDETLSPRVVLGSSYSEYYLSFDDKSGFELYLSSLGEIREGSYEVYDSVISVTYSDGKGAEFKIQRDDSGNLSGIIVPYGEYNVLFS